MAKRRELMCKMCGTIFTTASNKRFACKVCRPPRKRRRRDRIPSLIDMRKDKFRLSEQERYVLKKAKKVSK